MRGKKQQNQCSVLTGVLVALHSNVTATVSVSPAIMTSGTVIAWFVCQNRRSTVACLTALACSLLLFILSFLSFLRNASFFSKSQAAAAAILYAAFFSFSDFEFSLAKPSKFLLIRFNHSSISCSVRLLVYDAGSTPQSGGNELRVASYFDLFLGSLRTLNASVIARNKSGSFPGFLQERKWVYLREIMQKQSDDDF